ncbi:competence protein [Staphylococcus equorum]|uniref:Competence protein n=1 Tax=Staphylococcus equorum TaxID=246432 RepID=A0A9X4L9P2_9STAP|nr:competence protein CoiA family protein [Staphylococcus equorum]MDG0820075.1 competence protein [Staphylococcus equorum]MDG0840652.1 competence protein [Staphylococcus equorum]MDG0846399.1 competence protein [Staphylococcus equorum]
MLCAKNERNQIISAMIAHKGHQYTCPHCHNKVIFKKGQFIAPHFAHVSERGLTCNKGETYEHYRLKYQLAQWFEKYNYDVAIEPYITRCYQYPDLIINHSVAIEIQFSRITILNIKKRSISLQKCGLDVVWIINNPSYDKVTQILMLTTYERTYINLKERHLFAWNSYTQQLYRYKILQYLGGKRYVAIREIVSNDTLIHTSTHVNIQHNNLTLKLSETAITKYLKHCRNRRSVLEPSLSVMYQLQLSEAWISKHLGIIFPEQLYVKSHPVYWQLQLLFMLAHLQFKLSDFIKLIEYNEFYIGDINKEEIASEMVRKFQQLNYSIGLNNVQK